MLRIALLVVAVTAACSSPTVSGPSVIVLRGTAGDCWQLLSSPPPPTPVTKLGLPDPCGPDSPPPPALLAGIDLVEVVVDYGTFDIPASAPVPPPTIVITVDGKPSGITPAVGSPQRFGGHTFFVGTFTAPAAVSDDVRLEVDVATGFSTSVAQSFKTAAPQPAVSALKLTSTGCYALLTPNAPSADLDLPMPCGSSSATLVSAEDMVELVIDYGVLDVAPSVVIAPPPVTIVVDGTPSTQMPAVSPMQRVNGHLFFVASFRAPAAQSSNVRVIVGSGDTALTLTTVLSTTPPVPTVQVLECAGSTTCGAVGAVGAVHLLVTIPGNQSQMVSFHALLDHVPVADPASAVTTAVGPGGTTAQVTVPVPAAPDGTIWDLEAQLGPIVVTAQDITIHKPSVTLALSCSATISVGTKIGATITAPLAIVPQRATYSLKLDGVQYVTPATADLTVVDTNAGTVSTTLTLQAPATAGTWEIDTSVAGYAAPTQLVQVQ